jgi:hypothetical protein
MDTLDGVTHENEVDAALQLGIEEETQARPGTNNQNTSPKNTQSRQDELHNSDSSLSSDHRHAMAASVADEQPKDGQRKYHPYVALHFSVVDIVDSVTASTAPCMLPKYTSLLIQSTSDNQSTVLYEYVYATKARGAIKQWYWLWNDLFSFSQEEMAQQFAMRRVISPEQILAFATKIVGMKLADDNNGQPLSAAIVMRPLSCIFRYEIIQAWRYISRFDELMVEVNTPEGPHIKQASSMIGDLWVPSDTKGDKSEGYLKTILGASIGAWRARNPTTKSKVVRRSADKTASDDDESEPTALTLISESGEVEQTLVAESDVPSPKQSTRKPRSRKPSKKSETDNGLDNLLRATGLAEELEGRADEQRANTTPKKKRATTYARRVAKKDKQTADAESSANAIELSAESIAQQANALSSYMRQPFTSRTPMNSPSGDTMDVSTSQLVDCNQTGSFQPVGSNQTGSSQSNLNTAFPSPANMQPKRSYKPRASKQSSDTTLSDQHTAVNDTNFMVRTWSEMTYILPKQLAPKPTSARGPFTLMSHSPIDDHSRQQPKRIVMGRI